MVFHPGHQHGISGLRLARPQDWATRLTASVDPAVKMISSVVSGADVVGDLAPGAFVGFRGQLGEVVRSAVDVGVVVRQVFPLSLR